MRNLPNMHESGAAKPVNNFTADTVGPTVTGVELDMRLLELMLNFNETVNASSLDVTEKDGLKEIRTDGRKDGRKEGRTEIRKDGRKEGRTDGRTDGRTLHL